MQKKRTLMLILLIMFYLLIFLSILFDSKVLVLFCIALLVFYFALKKSNQVNKTVISSDTSDAKYLRMVRFLFIFICIPFIIIGISIFIFGLAEQETFLIFFGLFFFTIPVIILISSIALTSKMNKVSFDELETKGEKMPLLFKEDPHKEHDAFLNEYSSKDKECFEHEAKAKKKKKFRLFNEPEWDDENTDIDL